MKEYKKVAIVYRLDHPGGLQSCCFSLIKGLNREGIIPDVIWDIEPDWSLLRSVGCEARYKFVRFPISSKMITNLPFTFRYLAKVANTINGDRYRQDYDFFYIFYNGFLLSNGAQHVRYLPGPPLLPQLESIRPGIRGIPYKTFKWLYQNLLRKTQPVYEFHKENNYVTISQFTSALFQEAHGVELPVIHPPIDLSGQDFDFDDLNCRDTLTFFSRIVDYKRPEMVLELASRYRNMRCVIMGGVPPYRRSYFESLQTQAKEMGITEAVFLANPSAQRVKDELTRTRFYVFTAIDEHFGMTTVEATASGAIPYVHDSGGQKEIVIDSRLRFQDSEFFDKFDALINLSDVKLNNMRKDLFAHIQQYSEEVYISKMLVFINR